MSQTDAKLLFDSPLKSMIWGDISKSIEKQLGDHLAHSQLVHLTDPSEKTREQLAVVEAICLEIKHQLKDFNTKSGRRSTLDVLSRMATLQNLLKREEPRPL